MRDLLIENDRMKLALNVATKCSIECEPIWVKWGLSLLKLGMYNQAKIKFSYCLGIINRFFKKKLFP